MKTKQWSRGRLLKFSFITLVLILLLLELIGRILFYVKFHHLNTSVYTQGSPLLIEDSVTVYNNRPFYADYEKKFQYNQSGMKSRPGNTAMPGKKAGELWVLLLGASAMEGMGSNKNGRWLDITNVPDHPYSETIAAFLEAELKLKFPARKVKVFNAGVSGYTLSQSIEKYKLLSKQFQFDWVISMDGVNEPSILPATETMESYNRKQWAEQPSNSFPLNLIIFFTRHSAFFNLLKQELFYLRFHARLVSNQAKSFPERRRWLKQHTNPVTTASTDTAINRMVNLYLAELKSFQDLLENDGKQYLLLVQPHLSFRKTTALTTEETALLNYYRVAYNDMDKYTFLKNVYEEVDRWSATDVHTETMRGVNEWPGWTFVDYCHFTTGANRKIAGELAKFIGSGGGIRIFGN